jgi:hypothetical protein
MKEAAHTTDVSVHIYHNRRRRLQENFILIATIVIASNLAMFVLIFNLCLSPSQKHEAILKLSSPL